MKANEQPKKSNFDPLCLRIVGKSIVNWYRHISEVSQWMLCAKAVLCLILLMPSLPAAGCLFHQSPQGAEGEIFEEPRLLTAGQPAVYPSGQPGAPRMLPGDAVRTAGGPGRRVSPGTVHLINTYCFIF